MTAFELDFSNLAYILHHAESHELSMRVIRTWLEKVRLAEPFDSWAEREWASLRPITARCNVETLERLVGELRAGAKEVPRD